MKQNPLDHIKIASPCSADWDKMIGNSTKRFCSHCKLNVYNLSEMTQHEAANLLFESEGKMCVRLYKRSDGTVITQDCPIGWQRIKQRVSGVGTAAIGLIVGFCGGVFGFSMAVFDNSKLLEEVVVETEKTQVAKIVVGETLEPQEIKPVKRERIEFSGGISNGPDIMELFTTRYPQE